ncbi:MAG: basic secretory protein-like protein [Candidatus Xenobia bacterium]
MSRSKAFFLILLLLAGVAAADVTDDAAQTIYAQARAFDASLGLHVDRDIPLMVRTRDELEVENNTHGGRTLELNGFYRPYNVESIWVCSGLSPDEMFGTCCHELAHAWQSSDCPQQDRKLTEGFARWVEWKAMQSRGDEQIANLLLHDRDPDYGGGLRFLVNLEQNQGAAAVIQYAKTETRIP